jgi:CMP-N,N'-diacetyllegionaminic acid synthase
MYNRKTIVAIIPARGGSKGIHNKNIISICNRPLISWTITQAIESQLIDHVYVSTDDSQIMQVANEYGSEIIKRPEELSQDTSRTEDAIIHVIESVVATKKSVPDIVVLLQPTSPLRKENDIDNAIKHFIDNNFDSLFSSTEVADLTLWGKLENKWESINFDYKNKKRRQDRPKQYIENGSIYISSSKNIKRTNNIVNGTIGVFEMEFWQTWEIDTIDEVDLVEFYLKKMLLGNKKVILYKEHVDLIVFDFDGVMTDNKAILLEDGSEGVIVNRGDGVGINNLKKLNVPIIILTSESNRVVKQRAKKLNLEILSNIEDKKSTLKRYVDLNGFKAQRIVYIGNDLNDLEVMKWVGFPICPSDAEQEIKEISKIILKQKGGEAVTKEVYKLFN